MCAKISMIALNVHHCFSHIYGELFTCG